MFSLPLPHAGPLPQQHLLGAAAGPGRAGGPTRAVAGGERHHLAAGGRLRRGGHDQEARSEVKGEGWIRRLFFLKKKTCWELLA